jgi:hypothetical protein
MKKKLDQVDAFCHLKFITYEAEDNWHNHGYYCLGKIFDYSQEYNLSLHALKIILHW